MIVKAKIPGKLESSIELWADALCSALGTCVQNHYECPISISRESDEWRLLTLIAWQERTPPRPAEEMEIEFWKVRVQKGPTS